MRFLTIKDLLIRFFIERDWDNSDSEIKVYSESYFCSDYAQRLMFSTWGEKT